MLYNLRSKNTIEKHIGAKARNIAIMLQEGISAVDGYAIDSEITEDELNELFYEGNKMFAVRSSMSDEDISNSSSAGKYLTVLGIDNKLDMKKAVRKVLKSGENAKYKAACIQEMVKSEISGVMFTKSPLDDSKIHIESIYGLGELLVSGKVKPDSYLIDRESLSNIVNNAAGSRDFGLFLNTGNSVEIGEEITYSFGKVRKVVGLHNKFIGSISINTKKKPILTPEQIKELCQIGLKIEKLFGCPQDIEWSIEEGKVKILQSRPITNLMKNRKPAITLTNGEFKGIPASIGQVKGEVSINNGVSSKILVTYELTPKMVYDISNIKGIVTEVGGVLCHAAIVAREYNIPCIVGVDNISRVLKDGDIITMDGSTGFIKLDMGNM